MSSFQANKYANVTGHLAPNKYAKNSSQKDDDDTSLEPSYVGFTEKTLPKEKKANEFSTKKAITMDQAASLLAMRKKLEEKAKEDAVKAATIAQMKSSTSSSPQQSRDLEQAGASTRDATGWERKND